MKQNKIKYTPTGCFVLNDPSGGLFQIEFILCSDSLHRALSKTTSLCIVLAPIYYISYIYIYSCNKMQLDNIVAIYIVAMYIVAIYIVAMYIVAIYTFFFFSFISSIFKD